MKNLNPIRITNYKTREKRMKSINGFSFRDLFSLANVATLLFVALDFAVLYSRWETVQTESWYMVALIAVSSAVILDVPMMLAGKTIVEYQHNLKSKSSMLLTVCLSASAFVLVFGFSLWFSYVTRSATFQDAQASLVVNNISSLAEADGGESMSVLAAALFSGVLPLGTSIASLVIALITYKPIEEKRRRIARARILAEEHLRHIRQGIAESNAYISHGRKLLAREEDLFSQFKESVRTQENIRKNAYREALEEKCTLDDVNRIIESARTVNDSYSFDEDHFSGTVSIVENFRGPSYDPAA